MKSIPLDRLFLETDEGNMPIGKLYRKAAHIRNLPTHRLHRSIARNIAHTFPLEKASHRS